MNEQAYRSRLIYTFSHENSHYQGSGQGSKLLVVQERAKPCHERLWRGDIRGLNPYRFWHVPERLIRSPNAVMNVRRLAEI